MTGPPPNSVADSSDVVLFAGPRTTDRARERAERERPRGPHRPRNAVGPPPAPTDPAPDSAGQSAGSKAAAAARTSARALDRPRGRTTKTSSRARPNAHAQVRRPA